MPLIVLGLVGIAGIYVGRQSTDVIPTGSSSLVRIGVLGLAGFGAWQAWKAIR